MFKRIVCYLFVCISVFMFSWSLSFAASYKDTQAPVVSIDNPWHGSSFEAGSNVYISSSASDNKGVVRMAIYINDERKTYSWTSFVDYNWDTHNISAGTYTIKVNAVDAAGNVGSIKIKITITEPVIVISEYRQQSVFEAVRGDENYNFESYNFNIPSDIAKHSDVRFAPRSGPPTYIDSYGNDNSKGTMIYMNIKRPEDFSSLDKFILDKIKSIVEDSIKESLLEGIGVSLSKNTIKDIFLDKDNFLFVIGQWFDITYSETTFVRYRLKDDILAKEGKFLIPGRDNCAIIRFNGNDYVEETVSPKSLLICVKGSNRTIIKNDNLMGDCWNPTHNPFLGGAAYYYTYPWQP